VEVGSGSATVKIYTNHRKDGYSEFTLAWREGGRRRVRSLASIDEARLVAGQITVRLANALPVGDEATKRDLEMLRHCESLADRFGVTLAAAIEEWAGARQAAGEVLLSDAVRFYQTNRADLIAVRTVRQVADEFVESRRASGASESYVTNCEVHLKRFTDRVKGNIADVTVADINRFLTGLTTLAAISKNSVRRNVVTMFSFAKRQGYLHPERRTAAERSESFETADTEIAIFTPEEMRSLLDTAHADILPMVAIGAFAGIRSSEIRRLDWEDVKWERGHIEIAGRKAKTAARRLVPLGDNLKAWLAPWREAAGPIVTMLDPVSALKRLAVDAGIPGGWRQNALRHSSKEGTRQAPVSQPPDHRRLGGQAAGPLHPGVAPVLSLRVRRRARRHPEVVSISITKTGDSDYDWSIDRTSGPMSGGRFGGSAKSQYGYWILETLNMADY
jgi:integrase